MAKEEPERKKAGIAERGSLFLALKLRILSVLQCLAGAGYIAVAVVLQFPPGDSLTLGLWAIGCLAILTAICGLFGGCRVRCCLGIYTVLAVLATLAQAAFVLFLFIAPGKAEDQISNYQKTKSGKIKDNLHDIIMIGRWVLLGLLGAQVVAIVVASVLRWCTRSRPYEEFQEEEQQEYELRTTAAAAHLEQLKSKIEQQHAAAAVGANSGKRIISISAVSGSAAERMNQQQRSILFQRSDAEEGKLEADMEAGTIGCRVTTEAEPARNNPWDATGSQSSPAAWPQATPPSPQRAFKPSWSKAGRQ